MPYNTRRKSLSLPALGIQLPQSSRARRESVSKAAAAATSAITPTTATSTPEVPPAKRRKHSHGASSPSAAMSPPATAPAKTVTFADRPRSRGRPPLYNHTPPQSPPPSDSKRVDTAGINDDIVIGVIEQLETTGNRPHLIKELATVLSTTNTSVAKYGTHSDLMRQSKVANHLCSSANPAALLSSRLAGYMRRPWTALAPCPIAKELIPVHPRKVFYYLTTTPRQEMPTTPMDVLKGSMAAGKRIISPSVSNASQDEDDAAALEDRKRMAMSPSPEIDLNMDVHSTTVAASGEHVPDFPTPGSNLNGLSRTNTADKDSNSPEPIGVNRRSMAPIEGDEREFEEMAHSLLQRDMRETSLDDFPARAPTAPAAAPTAAASTHRDIETAQTLFGIFPQLPAEQPATATSDGLVVAKTAPTTASHDISAEEEMDGFGTHWNLGHPEDMDLDELDSFFDDY